MEVAAARHATVCPAAACLASACSAGPLLRLRLIVVLRPAWAPGLAAVNLPALLHAAGPRSPCMWGQLHLPAAELGWASEP